MSRFRLAGRRRAGGRTRAPLTVALLGAGGEAGIHGLAARAGGHRVVAVASGEASLAEARAEETGGEPMDVDALVTRAAELADVVVVTAPVAVRAALVLRLLSQAPTAGHAAPVVLVEPPLCATLAEADQVARAASAVDDRVRYGEHLLHAPVVCALLDRLDRIGDLTHLEIVTLGAARDGDRHPLVELGPRAVALALAAADRLALGAPTEVRARVDTAGDVTAVLHFVSGATAGLLMGHRAANEQMWHLQAAGTTGVVRAELLPFPSLDATGTASAGAVPGRADDTVVALGYVAQLDALGRGGVREGAVLRPDARFGRDVVDVVSAACHSLASGTPSPLPYVGPRGVDPDALVRAG